MTTVTPFRGLRYDPAMVGDLAAVTAPPYDVIGRDARSELERGSPYNVVRLILPRDDAGSDKYTRAARTLEAWISRGVLVRDQAESLTVYEQRFRLAGVERVQRGFLAAVALDQRGASILPHEHTMAAPVEDRLRLTRATRAQLSPVFAVYSSGDTGARDAVAAIVEREPLASWETADDGVAHRAWRIEHPAEIERVARTLTRATVVIADGHHRFRTALEYRAERAAADGRGPWDSMLFYLVDANWCGPALLPIHRALELPPEEVLAAVSGAFEVEAAASADPDALAADLARRREGGRCFALLGRHAAWWLSVADKEAETSSLPEDRSPEWRDLDVAVLEWMVLRGLLGGASADYVHTPAEAAAKIARGEAGSAILLAPPPFEAVRAVAEAGEAMPPKSTFFVPKPRTGVVIRPLF